MVKKERFIKEQILLSDMVKYNPESIEGVVSIYRDRLFAKSPESLSNLKDYLTKLGYEVEDSTKFGFGDKPPREVQEKEGWSLWYASVPRKGVCGSCDSLISMEGIGADGHECEVCGDYTFLFITDGGLARFRIIDDKENKVGALSLVIHSYDDDQKQINFYRNKNDCPNIKKSGFICDSIKPSYKKLDDAIEMFPETFTKGKIGGIKIISTPLDIHSDSEEDLKMRIDIEKLDAAKENYKEVMLLKEKKFESGWDLPVPRSVSIYESWHWAPLEPGQKLFKKVLLTVGIPPGKGRWREGVTIGRERIDGIVKFIDEFSTIDVKEIKQYFHWDLPIDDFMDVLAENIMASANKFEGSDEIQPIEEYVRLLLKTAEEEHGIDVDLDNPTRGQRLEAALAMKDEAGGFYSMEIMVGRQVNAREPTAEKFAELRVSGAINLLGPRVFYEQLKHQYWPEEED